MIMREVRLDAFRAELVAFKAATGLGRGRVLDAGARVAKANHRPLPGRHVPNESARSVHLRRQVGKHGAWND